MRIIQKHVTKEILGSFGLAFAAITFLTLVGELISELVSRFVNKGLSIGDIGMIILYLAPTLLTYTIPIALLFATIVAFIRFSQDYEIIAMKAAGIPIRKVFTPAILIGVAATLFLLVLKAEVSPWARRELKVFIIDLMLQKPTLALNEQAWTSEINNMRIFVGDIDDKNMLLKDVNVVISDDESPHRTIVAKSGKIHVDRERKKVLLELYEGSIHEQDDKNPDQYSTTTFGSLTVPASIAKMDRYIQRSEKYIKLGDFREKELSITKIIQKLFQSDEDAENRQDLLSEIGERLALAFMPLTFVLIGAPLGIIPYKARRFYGLAICGGLLLAFYSLFVLGETVSKQGLLNPIAAMWIPNLLLGAIGVGFMIRAEKR